MANNTAIPIFPKNAIISNDNRSCFAFEENNKTYRAINPLGKKAVVYKSMGNSIVA